MSKIDLGDMANCMKDGHGRGRSREQSFSRERQDKKLAMKKGGNAHKKKMGMGIEIEIGMGGKHQHLPKFLTEGMKLPKGLRGKREKHAWGDTVGVNNIPLSSQPGQNYAVNPSYGSPTRPIYNQPTSLPYKKGGKTCRLKRKSGDEIRKGKIDTKEHQGKVDIREHHGFGDFIRGAGRFLGGAAKTAAPFLPLLFLDKGGNVDEKKMMKHMKESMARREKPRMKKGGKMYQKHNFGDWLLDTVNGVAEGVAGSPFLMPAVAGRFSKKKAGGENVKKSAMGGELRREMRGETRRRRHADGDMAGQQSGVDTSSYSYQPNKESYDDFLKRIYSKGPKHPGQVLTPNPDKRKSITNMELQREVLAPNPNRRKSIPGIDLQKIPMISGVGPGIQRKVNPYLGITRGMPGRGGENPDSRPINNPKKRIGRNPFLGIAPLK